MSKKQAKKNSTPAQIDNGRAAYDRRKAFLAEHKASLSIAFKEKNTLGGVKTAVNLSPVLVCYALVKLGLVKTRDKHITVLLEGDKAFEHSKTMGVAK